MKNINYFLLKIYRLAAGLLFLSISLYILTGYGMTKGVVDYKFARNLHLNILPTIVLISFVAHSSLGARTTLMRWRKWNRLTMLFLIVFYISILLGFFYLEFLYKKSSTMVDQTTVNKITSAAQEEKTFTLEELAKYNGQDGMPAYAAVDGVVYDLTAVFEDGDHNKHPAGQELTKEFYSKHTLEEVLKYPVIGKLK